jgi:EmrB/QacA subfamily drug resistance transporter
MASQAKASATPIGPQVWRIAFVVVLGAFMAALDTSLVNVGLSTIVHGLNGPLASAQWIASGYLIALAAALPAGGWLGRRFGIKRMWLCSLAAFTLSSGLCALSTSLWALIVFRVLQGAAGGLLIPAGQTLLGRAAGPSTMGTVMNTAGIGVVIAPAIGPSIGGLLISSLSWQWLFLINVPVGLIALFFGMRLLPPDEVERTAPLDVTGLLLMTAGLPLLIIGIIQASAHHSTSHLPAFAMVSLGVLAIIAYLMHARPGQTRRTPLIDMQLFLANS